MADAVFPLPVDEVISTLAELFRHQGRNDVVELLNTTNAGVDLTDYDNWNGGTCTWTLRLRVPVALFAAIEPSLAALEKEIVTRLRFIGRMHANHSLGEVTIIPLAPGAAAAGSRIQPSEHQMRRLWPAGRFRLFLSHTSKHKIAVAQLKVELSLRGIAAFVAHEDIEPSLKWQEEIELGLRSMHALAALLTPDFHASLWTDQELGWALGRGITIIPVRYGMDPYGPAGKYQGIPGDFANPKATATAILKALMKNELTHGEMRRTLVTAFCSSDSYVMTQVLCKEVTKLRDLSTEEIAALRRACTENKNVADAYNIADAIYAKFGGRPAAAVQIENFDEEVPF